MDESEGRKVNSYAPHLALLAVQLFFGTLPVIGKVVLAVIPSVALVGFRVGITAFLLFVFQRSRGNLRLDERGDYFRLAFLSIFGVTINQLLFVGGLSLTKASNTSLLAVTIPIFALTIGAVWGVEKLRAVKVFGIVLAAFGVVLLIDPRNASFSSETTLGDLMIVLNSLSYGIYVASSKDVLTRNGAVKSITWIFVFASVVCVPLGLYSMSGVETALIAPAIWLLILYIAIIATALPYLFNAWALARVNPSTVAVYIYLQPVIGFLLAVALLGETVGLNFTAAALLIFAGVYLVTKKSGPGRT
ncbi:MAG: DMT family transporter [Pyrinomonadaceae bacterium]|nr:DMT family transporter [Acidobacteriota bacterium]